MTPTCSWRRTWSTWTWRWDRILSDVSGSNYHTLMFLTNTDVPNDSGWRSEWRGCRVGGNLPRHLPWSYNSWVVLEASHLPTAAGVLWPRLCVSVISDSQIRALEPLILAVHSLLLHCTAGPLRPLMNVSSTCVDVRLYLCVVESELQLPAKVSTTVFYKNIIKSSNHGWSLYWWTTKYKFH